MIMHQEFVFANWVESPAGASIGVKACRSGGENERDVVVVSESICTNKVVLAPSPYCGKVG